MNGKLNRLIKTKVAIKEYESNKVIKDTEVGEIIIPNEVDIDLEEDGFYLKDDQDADVRIFLGNSIEETLEALNTFQELFSGDGWIADFEYFTNNCGEKEV